MPEKIRQAAEKTKERASKFLELLKFYFIPQRKKLFAAVFVLFLAVALFGGQQAYAAFGGIMPDLPSLEDLMTKLFFLLTQLLGTVVMKMFSMIVYLSGFSEFFPIMVNHGWFIVRDVCNMFFVVFLLICAFAEIFNIQKYNIKSYLPKVLIAAVLVNFSKLICTLLIDMSQVVMMTFVNGYQAAAGANLVNGLGLDKLLQAQSTDQLKANLNLTNIMVSLFVACVYMLAVSFVILVILVVLGARIIAIWLFIIISPALVMADVFPFFGQKLAGLRDQFFGFLAIGPILAFGLWLSLLFMAQYPIVLSETLDKLGYSEPAIGNVAASASARQGITVVQDGETRIYADNPSRNEVILAAASAGELKKTESTLDLVTRGGTMQSLISSMLSLGMLAGTLVAASQLGGVAGAMAGSAIESGKKYAHLAGKKAVSPVTAGLGKISKEAKRVAGKGVELAKAGGKKVSAAGTESVKLAATGAIASARGMAGAGLTAVGTAVGSAGLEKAGTMARGSRSFEDTMTQAGERALFNVRAAGSSNIAASNKISQEKFKEKYGEAETRLQGMGIAKDYDAQNKALSAGAGKKEDLQAMSMNLAKAGKLQTKEQVATARQFLSEDKESLEAFNSAVAENQAHLGYDLTDEKDSKTSKYGRQAFEENIKSGKLDVSKQDKAFYTDTRSMQSAMSAMGAERFGKTMERVHDRAEDFAAPAKQAMVSAIRGIETKSTKTPEDRKALDALRKSFTSSNGKVTDAFSGVPKDQRGQAVGAFVGSAGVKALGKMNLQEYMDDPSVTDEDKELLAGNIDPGQLVKLADSDDERSLENLSLLVGQLEAASQGYDESEPIVQNYRKAISNPKIMEKVHSGVGGRVAARSKQETAVKAQAEREKKSQEEAIDRVSAERTKRAEEFQTIVEQRRGENIKAANAAAAAQAAVDAASDAISKLEAGAALDAATRAVNESNAALARAEKAFSGLNSKAT